MTLGLRWLVVIAAVLPVWACASTALARTEPVTEASRAAPGLRVSEKRAVPGQVVILSARRLNLRRARVQVGGKKARVLSRKRKRLSVVVPRLKAGRARVVVRAERRRLRGALVILRSTGGQRVRIALDTASAASGVVTSQGLVLSTTGADGTVYELTLPPGAALGGTTITLTPAARISGAPGSDRSPVGVDLGPDGLRFSSPATLRITPAKPKRSALGFTFAGNGSRTGLLVPATDGASLTLEIAHFSGAGAGSISEFAIVELLADYLLRGSLSRDEILDVGALIEIATEELHPGWCSTDPTCVAVRDRTRATAINQAGRCLAGAERVLTVGEAALDHADFWAELLEYDELDPLIGAGPARDAGCAARFLNAVSDLATGVRYPTGPAPALHLTPLAASEVCSDVPFDPDGDGQTVVVECAVLARTSVALDPRSRLTVNLAPSDLRELQLRETGLGATIDLMLSNAAYDAEVDLCDAGRFDEGRAELNRVRTIYDEYENRFADASPVLRGRIEEQLAGCPRITVTPENSEVEPGATVTFSATSEDPADTSFTFTSSDNRISAISGGYIAGEQPGAVTITATSNQRTDRNGTTNLTIVGHESLPLTATVSLTRTSEQGCIGSPDLSPHIREGGTVTWENNDNDPTKTVEIYNVEGSSQAFHLVIPVGGSGSVTFNNPGDFPYACDYEFTPESFGSVKVGGGS